MIELGEDDVILPPLGDLLSAPGPKAEHAGALDLYGRLVGSWDIDAVWYQAGRVVRSARGEWHFCWILGGLAIQDVLYVAGAPPDQRGTTLRCYDPGTGLWHVFWAQPCAGEFVHLVGRASGNGITQQSVLAQGDRLDRWSFRDITRDSFLWLGEVSRDGGATWQLEQAMKGTRRT